MPTAPIILAPPVGHISEFAGGFTGTCGECALSVATCASTGEVVTEDYMVALTKEMIAKGWSAANGASTIQDLKNEAEFRNIPVVEFQQYSEPFGFDWVSYLRANAGVVPIVIELANGQALHDTETGVGENATNLHYHYICVVGKQDDGYICADGDNFQVLQRFEIYSLGVLTDAKPCALLALKVVRNTASSIPTNLPTGWTDDGKTLRNPVNAFVAVLGIRDYILSSSWDHTDVPLGNEFTRNPVEYSNPALGEGTVQYFRLSGQLSWTKDKGVYRTASGQELQTLAVLVAAKQGQVDSLTGLVRTDQALINTMQAQLDAEKAQHAANDTAIKSLATALATLPK